MFWTVGNPLYDKYAADGEWVTQVSNRLKNLKKLDGKNYFIHLAIRWIIS